MHPMLNVAVSAARSAGRIINRGALDLENLRIARKQANDFVTEIDHAAEQEIIATLRNAYPHHGFLAEESGYLPGRDANAPAREAECLWIIDPLDGTTNFIHGMPQYAVSIALMQRGVVTQAVVYDPNRNELFTASKGAGAYLNNRRLRVSKRLRVEDALIGTGFPFRELAHLDTYLEIFKRVTSKCAGVRRPGAAALDLAYVASARYDAFFEFGLAPWDIAAGSLLVSEAGGLIGDFTGEADYLFSGQVLAGAPRVFGGMLTLLRGCPLPPKPVATVA